MTPGEAEKRKVLSALKKKYPKLVRNGQRALLTHLLTYGTATADDVREALPPFSEHPSALGAVPKALARAGIIFRDGFTSSVRKERRASIQSVWALANRTAAEEWLALHPPL